MPINWHTVRIQCGQARQHLLPVALVLAQRRQRNHTLIFNLFSDTQQRRFWANLYENGAALIPQRLYTIGKAHRVAQMVAPVVGGG